jgi:hypothetical protein
MTLRSARERVPTDAWGIVDGYEDTTGGWHAMPAETRRAILAAMGVDPAEPGPPAPPVQVLEPGRPVRLAWPAELRLEDGTTLCRAICAPGAGRCSSTRSARPRAGALAIWPTCAPWPAGRRPISAPGWCWSIRSTPSCRCAHSRRAHISRAVGASATRSTCESKRCRAPPRWAPISSASPPPAGRQLVGAGQRRGRYRWVAGHRDADEWPELQARAALRGGR